MDNNIFKTLGRNNKMMKNEEWAQRAERIGQARKGQALGYHQLMLDTQTQQSQTLSMLYSAGRTGE